MALGSSSQTQLRRTVPSPLALFHSEAAISVSPCSTLPSSRIPLELDLFSSRLLPSELKRRTDVSMPRKLLFFCKGWIVSFSPEVRSLPVDTLDTSPEGRFLLWPRMTSNIPLPSGRSRTVNPLIIQVYQSHRISLQVGLFSCFRSFQPEDCHFQAIMGNKIYLGRVLFFEWMMKHSPSSSRATLQKCILTTKYQRPQCRSSQLEWAQAPCTSESLHERSIILDASRATSSGSWLSFFPSKGYFSPVRIL